MPVRSDLPLIDSNIIIIVDNKLTFTDCCLLAQAAAHGLTVYTRDAKMQVYKQVSVTNPYWQ